jgi:hypothetical protein
MTGALPHLSWIQTRAFFLHSKFLNKYRLYVLEGYDVSRVMLIFRLNGGNLRDGLKHSCGGANILETTDEYATNLGMGLH